VTDIVQVDGIAFDRIEDAVDVRASAVEHLPQGDADLLRLLFGDRVSIGELAQLDDGFLQAGRPSDGGVWGSFRDPQERLDITLAGKEVTYKPEAQASGSMSAPGIHSLALRACIGFVRIFIAGVIASALALAVTTMR
jgi:hypothetical protein